MPPCIFKLVTTVESQLLQPRQLQHQATHFRASVRVLHRCMPAAQAACLQSSPMHAFPSGSALLQPRSHVLPMKFTPIDVELGPQEVIKNGC